MRYSQIYWFFTTVIACFVVFCIWSFGYELDHFAFQRLIHLGVMLVVFNLMLLSVWLLKVIMK